MFKLGDQLRNGSTVIAYDSSHVLAFTGHEYAVWNVDQAGHAYWGRYFPGNGKAANQHTDLRDAMATFIERIGRV